MGQVSLPVLSRKGKYDDWNYIWTSFKNYSTTFNEDLFLKKFFFFFFMYGISWNKNFFYIFFKKQKSINNDQLKHIHKLVDLTTSGTSGLFKNPPHNKFYVTKIFLCRHTKWVYSYIYIYSITNLRIKNLKLKKKIKNYNKHLFYQIYLKSKYEYIIRDIHKNK